MRRKEVYAGLGLALILLIGCQGGMATKNNDKQANAYIEQAQAFETQGNFVEALEQYKLAQAIDPNDPVVTKGIQRLEAQLDALAEKHYQAGLRLRDKGQWGQARKEFLEALRLRPGYEKAAAMLQQRQPQGDRKYITHTIAPGESISKLALKYYGDYKKYPYIANFNHMTNATQVRVGQRILIPEIEGVSIDDLMRISSGAAAPSTQPATANGKFTIHQIQPGESLAKIAQKYYGDYKLYQIIADYNGITDPTSIKVGQKVKVPQLEGTYAPQPAEAEPEREVAPYASETAAQEATAESMETSPPLSTPPPETTDVVDQVAEYRDAGISFFNEQKYDEAITELQKVLSASPDDTEARLYISRAYVEMGKSHIAANQISEAKTALATALEYDESCTDCQSLLAECRSIEATDLRNEGESLLRSNQFDKAIATLERATALNPNDAAATDLLFQSHYQQGLILYDQEKYMAAKTSFEKAAALKPDCSDCTAYVEKSLSDYKDLHYNQGIIYFGQQELKQAIASWQKVIAVDPDYKDVQQNLRKATLLEERLEKIRQSSTE